MTENVIIVTFDPLITMSLISRRKIKTIIKAAIKEAIKEAEANHRVYKLDELDDDE